MCFKKKRELKLPTCKTQEESYLFITLTINNRSIRLIIILMIDVPAFFYIFLFTTI